jgi:hypothetical protein
MTGRTAGYCAGYPVPGFANPTPGRGFWGRGRGGGWGRRNWYYATGLPGWAREAQGWPVFSSAAPYGGVAPYTPPYAPTVTKEQELDALKAQADYFENALDEIKKRVEELDAESEK